MPSSYDEIRYRLRLVDDDVDIANFCVHYLQEFLDDSQLHDIQELVDAKALLLHNKDTWE